MRTHEHVPVTPAARYFTDALILDHPKALIKRLTAWRALDASLRQAPFTNPDIALADAVSRTIEARQRPRHKPRFQSALVFVGQQGSGKDYIAKYMERFGYVRVTMSDIVKAIAPALGYSPDTTQGKIDAGHAMRKIFGKRVFTDLGFSEALQHGVRRVIITGPRSAREIYAARDFGARVIGIVAEKDARKDRAIRMKRVTAENRTTGDGQPRVMTPLDFAKRERQEYTRIKRLMLLADKIVVNNRSPSGIVSEIRT